MLPIYVIANGDMFREAFNAISTVIGTSTFATALNISAIFAVLGGAVCYIKVRDLLSLAKWFGIYFFVIAILLGPKVNIQILDSSDPGRADLAVDNVPYGLAMPASIVTEVGYALARSFDDVFHMPDDLAYTKTGMLFGSNLFRLGVSANIGDPNLKSQLYDYLKNCVFGDILINHKYTLDEVVNSADIWSTISQNPSPIRGLYISGKFYTCRAATPILQKELKDAIGPKTLNIFANSLVGENKYLQQQFALMLANSYNYFTGVSDTATNILQQNMMINAFSNGVANYAASVGNTAALENYSNTTSLEKMRLSWATSRDIATHTLPLMQTVLLLLMLCLFPIVILLAVQPVFGLGVLKNYLYTLLWLETWPVMFAILNFAATFYLKHHTSALSASGVTLSNANQLALEHSDIAGIAGYLTLAIPFISMGIVKGMAVAFNQAAQYIGGVTHSIIQGSSSEAVMGNVSLGNTNYHNISANNLSANKHDNNFTNMHGMMTEQLSSGASLTHSSSGEAIYNTGSAISNLPISVNASQVLSSTFGKSSDHYLSAAQTQRQSYDKTMSSAFNDIQAYDHAIQNGTSLSNTYSDSNTASFDKAVSNMHSIAHEVSTREGISEQNAFQTLSQASLNESLGVSSSSSFLGKVVQKTTGISGDISASGRQQAQSTHDSSYNSTADHNLSNRDIKDFRSNLNTAMQYAHSHSSADTSGTSASIASKLSADLRQAQSASMSVSADLAMGARMSQMASFSESHSASIQNNFNQGFVDYVKQVEPSKANTILANTSSGSIAIQRDQLAQNYMASYAKSMEQQVAQQASSSSINSTYQDTVASMPNSSNVAKNYANSSQTVNSAGAKVHFNESQAQNIQDQAATKINSQSHSVGQAGENMASSNQQQQDKVATKISSSKQKDQVGVINHLLK